MAEGFTSVLRKTLDRSAETALDKTTRLAREILEEEARQREIKTAQLWQSRCDREDGKNVGNNAETAKDSGNEPPTNAEGQS